MKNKLVSLIVALASALNVNASSGSLDVDYTSKYNIRNVVLDTESVTTGINLSKSWSGINFHAEYQLSKSLDSVDIDDVYSIGVNEISLGDKTNLYIGLYNRDASNSESLEFKVEAQFDTVLSPTLSLYREVDDNVYTGEISISRNFSAPVDFTVTGIAGATESVVSDEYVSAGVRVPYKLSETACLHLDGNILHSSEYGESQWFGVGASFNF